MASLAVSDLSHCNALRTSFCTKRAPSVLSLKSTRTRPSLRTTIIRSHAEVETALDRAACPAVKTTIPFSAFEAVDIRVGVITDAKTVLDPEVSAKRGQPTMSRKCLQLKVDIGQEVRTVISECRYVMDVEDAVGKKVLFVANVPETEVNGVLSHGLILTGLNYDPTPMPRSFKVILPGLGKLPPGAPVSTSQIPK